MAYLVVLIAVALLPVLAIVLLRVNAAVAFMSLALGSLLVTYAAPDVNAVFGGFSATGVLGKYDWVKLGLLVLPFLLTVLFARKSVKGAKQLLNILPALASGLLLVLLVVPLLPADVQRHVHHEVLWKQLDNLQTGVVLGGAAFSLLFLFFARRKKSEDEDKKHGKS